MKSIILFILFALQAINISSQFDLALIPDSLKLNADAVVLKNDERLEIFSKSKLIRTTSSEILVLNNNKNQINEIIIGYDQFTKVEELNITILAVDGKKIKTIKKKDFLDQVAEDGISVATDDRFLYYKVVENKSPYIIIKEIKTSGSQSLNIPGYSLYEGNKVSVLKSTFTITNFDINNRLRLKETILGKPTVDSTSMKHEYNWTFYNKTASRLKSERELNKIYSILPILENFQMDGVEGSLKNWQTFGVWLSKLNEGLDVLSEKAKDEIKTVIGFEKNEKEITKKLYRYLQENMRYVSIQLGIGGYRPMPAQSVHEFKYGDCKALSNYMKAILNVAGISSRYIIINAGKNALSPDPSDARNVFNHAILAVPFEKDTLFLECTSKDVSAGYQGSFTGNRLALLVNGEESGLVKTTHYNHTDNEIFNRFDIQIKKDLPAQINHQQKLKGIGTEFQSFHLTKNMSDEKFKIYLLDNIYKDISDLVVNTRKDTLSDGLPVFNMSATFSTERKILKSGERYFVETDLVNGNNELAYDLDKIREKCRIMYGLTITDTINIQIPVGCYIEKMPKVQLLKFDAGEIDVSTNNSDGAMLRIYRKITYYKGEYFMPDKGSVTDLLASIKKILAEKVVINCKS
jgi:hypothetical protein